ncbi:MAG: hypothetical protein HY747_04350 [Elusimicrobia bacterium]|nr:hypothetical protein [Elusimicrobiota bacterium]
MALEQIETLAQGRWRLSQKPEPLVMDILKIMRPGWRYIFSRRYPAYLSGLDLEKAGVPSSARGQILQELLLEVLKGRIASRRQAVKWISKKYGFNLSH